MSQTASSYGFHRHSRVVLWMLVYQRLKPDASLENAVKHLIDTRPSYLPENKRLQENRLSTRSSSYSVARSRLPLEVVEWFTNEISRSIISTTKPTFGQRRVFTIDGLTTIALAPEKVRDNSRRTFLLRRTNSAKGLGRSHY